MFLRKTRRRKDGKVHEYYSVVENRRVPGGRHVQQTLLHLGEISDGQKKSWKRAIDVVDGDQLEQMSLFAQDNETEVPAENAVAVQLNRLELQRPRQWGPVGWPVNCGNSWG